MTSHEEARAALEAKADAERQLAAAADCPPWRHAAFGAVMAAFVATPAFDLPLRGAIAAIACLATVLIMHWDRRRTGMFINGYRAGKTRAITFALLAVELILYSISTYYGIGRGMPAISLGAAFVAFAAATAASVAWQRVYLRELGG